MEPRPSDLRPVQILVIKLPTKMGPLLRVLECQMRVDAGTTGANEDCPRSPRHMITLDTEHIY